MHGARAPIIILVKKWANLVSAHGHSNLDINEVVSAPAA